MFIKGNSVCKDAPRNTKQRSGNTLSIEEWKVLATTLCCRASAVVTRRKSNDAALLRFGSRVEVKFVVDGGEEFYLGTVMSGTDDNFTIVFEATPDKFESFKPLTVDSDWRFAE